MKFVCVMLAVVLAAPVAVAVPTPSDAQVLAGRGGDTRRAPSAPRPALSEREEDRLFAAEDAVIALTEQIAQLEAVAEPTAQQTAQLEQLRERRDDEQGVVDRLQRKRDRRS